MRLWLEQKTKPTEDRSAHVLQLPTIHCSDDQKRKLQEMAQSRTIGLWRVKRAKAILGASDGQTLERLVMDLRVPPESVVKCLDAFSKQGLKSLQYPARKPTGRENRVEKMIEMLEKPSLQQGEDWKYFSVRYIGIDFTGAMILKIRAIILSHPEATRGALARILSQEFGLYSPTGKAKNRTIVDILKRMDTDNLIRLPPVASNKPCPKPPMPQPPILREQDRMVWYHKDLEPLMFVPIQSQDQQHMWNDMMSRYHYLKRPRLFGRQIRYLIWSGKSSCVSERSRTDCGLLVGAIGFSQSAWRLASRDVFIGWDNQQREKNLNLIIGNSRFLILPWIRCPNLASMILGRIAKRIASDWKATYGVQPVLLETFVRQDRFSGTCYRAANWIEVGSTRGYSYFSRQKKLRASKIIFLYPLCKNFRRELLRSP